MSMAQSLAWVQSRAVAFSARVLSITDWIGQQLHISSKWASRGGFIVLWGIGMTLIQVDEYAVAIALWISSSVVLLAKAIHWRGVVGHSVTTRLLRIMLVLVSIGSVPVSVIWTQAKRGDKPWTALQKIHRIGTPSTSTNTATPPGAPSIIPVPKAEDQSTTSPLQSHQRAEPKDNDSHQPIVRLIFRDSPGFTVARKRMVQETIDSYYLYLVGMGFDPPKDLPPLGLVTGSSIPLLRAVYDNHALQGGISVGADSGIEGPAMAYGFWAFYRLLEPEPIYDRQMYLSQAQHQLWQYFGRVFLDRADRVPDWPTKGGNWLPALLEIRRTCGAYFTDHSLALVVKVIREYYKPNEAQFSNRDQFLAFYLKFAESLIEDPHDPKTPCSDAILLRNGLLKPTK